MDNIYQFRPSKDHNTIFESYSPFSDDLKEDIISYHEADTCKCGYGLCICGVGKVEDEIKEGYIWIKPTKCVIYTRITAIAIVVVFFLYVLYQIRSTCSCAQALSLDCNRK
jgi:hypothetical protein